VSEPLHGRRDTIPSIHARESRTLRSALIMIAHLALALAACNGEMVTGIDVRVHPPTTTSVAADALERASEITGMHFATTRVSIARTYLLVREGHPCRELDRTESERILRNLTFISSAEIYVIPDGPGQIKLQVEIIDEFPILAGLGVGHGSLSSLTLGSQNLDGRGLLVAARITRGFAYRTGFGLRATKFGAFGRRAFLGFDVEREPHGERVGLEAAEPFLTDVQRNAYHISVGSASTQARLLPFSGEEVALFTRRAFWDVGWVRRSGTDIPGRTVSVIGVVAMGEQIHVGTDVVIISPTGLLPAPDPALPARYHDLGVARVAAIAGLRQITYITVRGFDAVRATQDVGIGTQFGLLLGPSVWATAGDADLFLASDFYAGGGDAGTFYTARVLAEARGNYQSMRWDGLVGNARFSLSSRTSANWTTHASLEGSILQGLSFPSQLTFRDSDGGVRGYADAIAAGGRRAVIHLERRVRLPTAIVPADLALAAFTDAGKIWAGDAPYGVTTPVRASLGFSILGAYPSGSKRTYRVDFAYPLNPETGRGALEVRLSSSNRTTSVWMEPRDVAYRRTGAMPATLLKW